MEVIIATVIFTLTMAGIFASISQLRKPAVDSSREVTAAFLGKQILDDLRSKVDPQTWSTGGLAVGTYGPIDVPVGDLTYTYRYTVSDDPNATSARQVTITVSWP